MFEVRRIIILTIIWILDALDAILQFFGVKIAKLTRERIYSALSPEEIEETKKPDVAMPFQKFIKVCTQLFLSIYPGMFGLSLRKTYTW